jgi:hypothetical protein
MKKKVFPTSTTVLWEIVFTIPTDEEKTVNGIRFTPMKYDVK